MVVARETWQDVGDLLPIFSGKDVDIRLAICDHAILIIIIIKRLVA